jgi:RNA polymerase sigma-70 factor (ECF subfamily)
MVYTNHPTINDLKNENAEQIFQEIYEQHFRGLCSSALAIVRCVEISRGIVQNVFLKLWEKRSQADNTIVCLEAYLYSSVRNYCLDYIDHAKIKRKHHDRLLKTGNEIDFNCPELICIEKEKKTTIQEVIKSLPGQCKKIFLMRYEKELSYSEIAKELGISIGTVKTQINRAKDKLAKSLEGKI